MPDEPSAEPSDEPSDEPSGEPSDATGREVPMFPLGSVLFPRAVLPLHVFEPRYRALVAHCLTAEVPFGVVLIERGHEVGGGDTRFPVGTLARIVQAAETPDGRWAVVAVGTERVRVVEWLPDRPFPRAVVAPRPERPPARDAAAAVASARAALVRVHALRAELGLPAPPGDVLVGTDVAEAAWEASILAPVGPLDAYALLDLDDPVDRLERVTTLLEDEIAVLQFRLSG